MYLLNGYDFEVHWENFKAMESYMSNWSNPAVPSWLLWTGTHPGCSLQVSRKNFRSAPNSLSSWSWLSCGTLLAVILPLQIKRIGGMETFTQIWFHEIWSLHICIFMYKAPNVKSSNLKCVAVYLSLVSPLTPEITERSIFKSHRKLKLEMIWTYV